MVRLIKNCRTAQMSAMIAWLMAILLHCFVGNTLSLVALWVSGTVVWTLGFVLLYLERAVTQNAAKQLEALQMTYRAARQAYENADYKSVESLERALHITPATTKSKRPSRDYRYLKAALQSLNKKK